MVYYSGTQWFWHQGPVLRKTVFPGGGEGDGVGMIQAHYIYYTHYLYYCYISSTSDHQALVPGGWRHLDSEPSRAQHLALTIINSWPI